MCTLTYRLTDTGYELFFNRDEQRSRDQAIPPQINFNLKASYPIDPVGKGTWLAVHESGLSIALLNYYQAEKKAVTGKFISRGEIILNLLKSSENIAETFKQMPLKNYQAFQLVIFPSGLTKHNASVRCLQWDGHSLTELQQTLPITSSGVDYPEVYQARKATFNNMVTVSNPTTKQLTAFHQSQQVEGKLSVKMCREDAKTVSFSRIAVDEAIEFEYVDYLNDQRTLCTLARI